MFVNWLTQETFNFTTQSVKFVTCCQFFVSFLNRDRLTNTARIGREGS